MPTAREGVLGRSWLHFLFVFKSYIHPCTTGANPTIMPITDVPIMLMLFRWGGHGLVPPSIPMSSQARYPKNAVRVEFPHICPAPSIAVRFVVCRYCISASK